MAMFTNLLILLSNLFAGARMRLLEQLSSEDPPYMNCVEKFTRYIIDFGAQVTPSQISQTLWAVSV